MTHIVKTSCTVAIIAVSASCKTLTVPRSDSIERQIGRIMIQKK
uniref:Uncharacterized protein n=1 Tax=Arundo donax TaxID=35708 RepID=A0A0A8YAI4_ARUDO